MLQWLNCRPLAEKILADLKAKIAENDEQIGLAAIAVGDDPSSAVYLRLKEKACHKVGIAFEKHYFANLPSATRDPDREAHRGAKLLKLIATLNARPDIHGILLQLPLPAGIDPDPLIAAIDPKKDVDGFHPQNQLALTQNNPSVISPLLRGAGAILSTIRPELHGQSVLVVAKSQIFASGAADYFKWLGCSVKTHLFKSDTTSSQSENTDENATSAPDSRPQGDPSADIIFTAVGSPGCLSKFPLKPGVIILDAGSKIIDGKSHGDLDPATAENTNIAYATPVPGGLGPLTVAMLLQNTYDLAQKQKLPV